MFRVHAALTWDGRTLAGWLLALVLTVGHPAQAAELIGRSKPIKATPGSVQVSFLPPPLADAVYSVGVYDSKTGRLVRRLHEGAPDEAFTAGLNGFITHWDRKDDNGKTVPAGKYTARGWAVGEKLNVEGVDVIGNGWTDEDEDLRVVRAAAIGLVPADGGLAVLAAMAGGRWEMLRLGADGGVLWRQPLETAPKELSPVLCVQDDHIFIQSSASEKLVEPPAVTNPSPVPSPANPLPGDGGNAPMAASNRSFPGGIFQVADGKPPGIISQIVPTIQPTRSQGKDRTSWELTNVGLQQFVAPPPARAGEALAAKPELEPLRTLPFTEGEPRPRAVSASQTADRLYLLEESPGWQRVRGLEWVETKQDERGQPVSEWKTFFERSIRRPDPALGLDDPATAKTASPVVELPLARNPLEPGKRQTGRLRAGFDEKGSYLETHDGLRLRQISERPNLRAVKLAKGKAAGALTFYQTDGAAWDEFSLTAVPGSLMAFDAGEFELTATGEKRAEGAATEPRDL